MNMVQLFWLLIIPALGCCHEYDTPWSIEIGNSIKPTFAEVKRIARRGPSLTELINPKVVTILPEIVDKEVDKDKSGVTRARKRRQGESSSGITSNLNSSATESPSNLTSAAPSLTTTTNLLALEESFGGTTRKPDPVIPANRKSGLYFLVDWNTFLEVGEEGRKDVNLRFQPKAGDRSRFLPVTVP